MYINTNHRMPEIRLSGRVPCYMSGKLHGVGQEKNGSAPKVLSQVVLPRGTSAGQNREWLRSEWWNHSTYSFSKDLHKPLP